MISEEAVEAAAKASYEMRPATYYLDDSVASWEQLGESGSGQRRKDRQIAEARAALEAAAPYMLAEPYAASVWDEAVNVLYMGNAINQDHMKAMWEHNPYRSQA